MNKEDFYKVVVDKLITALVIIVCFMTVLFSATIFYFINQIYNYDYPDNTNVNVNGGINN